MFGFSCRVQWERVQHRTEFHLSSSETLKLNITSTLVELYNSVKEIWTQDYYNPKDRCVTNILYESNRQVSVKGQMGMFTIVRLGSTLLSIPSQYFSTLVTVQGLTVRISSFLAVPQLIAEGPLLYRLPFITIQAAAFGTQQSPPRTTG